MVSFSASLLNDDFRKASSDHKFIRLVSNGEITEEQFNIWLSQDYLFVIHNTHFVAQVLANASRNDYKFLINGLSTLEQELTWFEKKLNERNISINNIKPLSANLNYQHQLDEFIQTKKSYLSLITVTYAIEFYYYQAWKSVNNLDYQEFIDRWTSKEFEQYIKQLQSAVDDASTTASENDKNEARQLWN